MKTKYLKVKKRGWICECMFPALLLLYNTVVSAEQGLTLCNNSNEVTYTAIGYNLGGEGYLRDGGKSIRMNAEKH